MANDIKFVTEKNNAGKPAKEGFVDIKTPRECILDADPRIKIRNAKRRKKEK